MRLLFLALSTRGYGETILGVRLAETLRAIGHEVAFLAHSTAEGVLRESGMRSAFLPDHALQLLRLYVAESIRRFRPDALVLSDYFTAFLALQRCGATLGDIAEHRLPIFAIDTWDFDRGGFEIDVYGTDGACVPDWRVYFAKRFVPVPIAAPEGCATPYSSIPRLQPLAKRVRRHVRNDLGLADGRKSVLFCTAAWQMADYTDKRAAAVVTGVLDLVALYVAALGSDVHFVHIGPRRLELGLGDRYYWLPQLPPERFEAVVSSVDALLSLNVSATTIAMAMAAGVPVVNLHNSRTVTTRDELEALCGTSSLLSDWASSERFLYPFRVWPLGFYRLLTPVLAHNPYAEALTSLELLDGPRVIETLAAFLRGGIEVARAQERQAAYVETVQALEPPDLESARGPAVPLEVAS